MANVKISELLEAGVLDGLEDLPIVQDAVTVRCSMQDIADFATGKVLQGYLTQTGTSAPVLTVLKNTTGGTPVLAYSSTGTYTLTITGAFTADKTFIMPRRQVLATDKECIISRSNADALLIQTFTTSTGTAGNGLLADTPIEVTIYP